MREERYQRYKAWLLEEERNILLRMEKAVERGETLHPNQIKVWRSEMRVPAMFLNIKLTEKEIDEIGALQKE